MKKIILMIILFLSAGFLIKISAQTPSPYFNLKIPGKNCGIPDDPLAKSCCSPYRPDFKVPAPAWISAFFPFFGVGQDLIEKMIVQPITNSIYGAIGGIDSACLNSVPSTPNINDPSCECINPIITQPTYLSALSSFCQRQTNDTDRNSCMTCINGGGVYSGIGCVYTDKKLFIEKTIFGTGVGLAGGLALLCIIYSAFMMQSSQGNPEKLKKAQEMITSCIMGLMLIIFSVLILKLIGVNILKIPSL